MQRSLCIYIPIYFIRLAWQKRVGSLNKVETEENIKSQLGAQALRNGCGTDPSSNFTFSTGLDPYKTSTLIPDQGPML
jgi:hypothetical protein